MTASPGDELQEDKTKDEQEDKEENEQEIGPELDEQEEGLARDRARPNAAVILEVIRIEGNKELERPGSALAWSGLAAGLSMGFSMAAEGLLREALPDAPWRPLIEKFGYCAGFLIVVLGRQQLFTENTLTPIVVLLSKRSLRTLWRVLRLWAIVLATNLLGALIFSWVASHTNVFSTSAQAAFGEIGKEALSGGFSAHLLRGIFAGWLIALMVWLLPGAEQARLQIIVILTYLVGLAGLSHVIAGSVEVLYLVVTGDAAWGVYLGEYLAPTLIGNILGGVTLVAALNYAQVIARDEE